MKFFILRSLFLFFTWTVFSSVCIGYSGDNNQKKEVASINLALDSISKIFEHFPTDLIRIREGAILLENLNQTFHSQTESFEDKKKHYLLISKIAHDAVPPKHLPHWQNFSCKKQKKLRECFWELKNSALISNEVFNLLDDFFIKGKMTGGQIGSTMHGGLLLGGSIGVFFGIVQTALGVKYASLFRSKDIQFPTLGLGITAEGSKLDWDQGLHGGIFSLPQNYGLGVGIIVNKATTCKGGGFFIGPLLAGTFIGGRGEYPLKLVRISIKRNFKMLRERLGLFHTS